MSDGFLSPLASEFLSPYFDMLDALGPGKMNRIAHSEKLVTLLAQVQLEARKEIIEQIKQSQFNDTSELEQFHIERLLNRLAGRERT